MSEKNVYRVRLLRWGDSSSSGRTVTFKLPDDEEDHPFKGLDVGSKNGQLLEMEIAIYDGDGDVETLGRIRKPRARIKPYLPVISDEAVTTPPAESGRKRAALENVTRRIIKAGTEAPGTASAAAQGSLPGQPSPTTQPAAPIRTTVALPAASPLSGNQWRTGRRAAVDGNPTGRRADDCARIRPADAGSRQWRRVRWRR